MSAHDYYHYLSAYQAPKVHEMKHLFDARAADIWSLGVVLFMLIVGAAPFLRFVIFPEINSIFGSHFVYFLVRRPVRSEFGYEKIADGKLAELLKSWNRLHYVTEPMLDLLTRMLQKEESRITMKDILRMYLYHIYDVELGLISLLIHKQAMNGCSK